MELIKPQKGTNYNIEHDIQNLTTIEQGFEQIDNKITNDITSSIDELKDKVDNDITAAITELDNKVDTEIVTAIDNLETKVNTEISESITALDNKVTTSLQEQAESLKKEISDQIAKVVANSPEDFDTLKEISDWISDHSGDASAMNSAISGNTSAINQEILDRQAADTALQANIDKKVDKDLSNVTGVLPISKGGTEATTQTQINKNIATEMKTVDSIPSDTSLFAMKDIVESNTPLFARTALTIWNYIKGKIESITINLFNSSKIKVTGTSDVTLTSFDTDPLTVGTKTSTNLGIDGNEIQARTNGAASILHLNNNGGDVYIGTKGTFTDNGLSYNGNATTATQATGATPFNAAQQTVTAGTVTRAVAQNVIKKDNGYISRIALGLTNKTSQFSDGIISLGSNDAGTTWEDFTLKKGTGGEIITSATIGSQTVAVAGKASSCTGNAATAGTADTAKGWQVYALNDLKSLSNSNFYPVVIDTGFNFVDVEIYSESGLAGFPYNQNRIKFTISAAGWSDTPVSLFISEYNRYEDNEVTIGCIGYCNEDATKAVIWLRGGLNYTCYTMNCPSAPAVKTANTALGNSIVTVGTSYSGGTNTKVSILFTPKSTMSTGIYSSTGMTTARNLAIKSHTSANLSTFGQEPLSIGDASNLNVGLDHNVIQARNNGAASGLYLNHYGGKVYVNNTKNSSGGLKVEGNTTVLGLTNVDLDTHGKEPLSIGEAAYKNIGIDSDDIQARSNGAASSLDLNYYGGMVRVNAQGLANGGLKVGGRLTIPTSAPSNPQAGDIWIG